MEGFLFRLKAFATEHCCDRVYVYDGGSSSSKLLGDFSGNSLPSNLSSSSNQLFVVFNSDGSDTDRGFSAKYASAGKGKFVELPLDMVLKVSKNLI